jgi:ATP-binding cassette subfamily C protein
MRQVGYTVARVATDLRLQLLKALLSTRWEYFSGQPVGKLANAISSEAYRASDAYLKGASLMAAGVQLAAAAAVALMIAWRATLIYLGVAVLVSWFLRSLVRAARRAGARQTKFYRLLLSALTDTLQSVKPLKAMAREGLSDALLASQTNALDRALRKAVISKEGLKAIQDPAFVVLVAAAAWVGLEMLKLPVSSVTVLILLLWRVLSSLKKVQSFYQEMVIGESAYWAIRATIDEAAAQVEVMPGERRPTLEREIRFERVGFAYGESAVLRDLSIAIPVGRLTTLVGFSGAGKTTIVDLVIGLVRPTAGQIWLDDTPLEEIDLRAWRRSTGYVPQENLLFHDSVLRNVTLGDPELGEADAEQALRAADAWDFVAALPEGLHATVGERGTRLSGGQRQRIMIARALVHRPQLLILDEATSALDPASASALAETIRGLRGRMTILAVSHQSDLVKVADRIYRLEQGLATLVTDRSVDAPTGDAKAIRS